MLCVFVELVLHAASTLRMIRRRLPAECHSDVTPTELPEAKNGKQQEVQPDRRAPARLSARSAETTEALILMDRQAIVSKGEGVLTDTSHTLARHRECTFLVPLVPAKAGIQSCKGTRAITQDTRTPPLIPAFAGTSGDRVTLELTAPA